MGNNLYSIDTEIMGSEDVIYGGVIGYIIADSEEEMNRLSQEEEVYEKVKKLTNCWEELFGGDTWTTEEIIENKGNAKLWDGEPPIAFNYKLVREDVSPEEIEIISDMILING